MISDYFLTFCIELTWEDVIENASTVNDRDGF